MLENYECDNQLTIEDYLAREPGTNPTLETRHDSHESVDKKIRYRQIIECLLEYPPLSAKEVAVRLKLKGYTPTDERNFSAPRLTELSKKGIVEPVGKKRCEYTGKMVAVYALKES